MKCVWQFVGQWWMISDHANADAGTFPSCLSVAEAENAITSPTFQVRVESGLPIVTTGGVLSAWISTLVVDEAPKLSVTLSPTSTVPGPYVRVGFTTVESSYWPSPSRSHAYVIESPGSGSDEPPASNCTASGASPFVGVALATATGGWSPAEYRIRWISPSWRST